MSRARSAWNAVRSLWPVVKRGLGFAFVWSLFSHRGFAMCCWLLLMATATGAVAGALGGYLSFRSGQCRDLRLFWREACLRGARHGATAAWGIVLFLHLAPPWLLGLILGFLGGVTGAFLSKAEQSYAQAISRLKSGDRVAARKSIREYLKHAGDDPARLARLPVAERFLEDDRATLDVTTELEAAPAPQGRGTELERSLAPVGRGTEPESTLAPQAGGTELQAEAALVPPGEGAAAVRQTEQAR